MGIQLYFCYHYCHDLNAGICGCFPIACFLMYKCVTLVLLKSNQALQNLFKGIPSLFATPIILISKESPFLSNLCPSALVKELFIFESVERIYSRVISGQHYLQLIYYSSPLSLRLVATTTTCLHNLKGRRRLFVLSLQFVLVSFFDTNFSVVFVEQQCC